MPLTRDAFVTALRQAIPNALESQILIVLGFPADDNVASGLYVSDVYMTSRTVIQRGLDRTGTVSAINEELNVRYYFTAQDQVIAPQIVAILEGLLANRTLFDGYISKTFDIDQQYTKSGGVIYNMNYNLERQVNY